MQHFTNQSVISVHTHATAQPEPLGNYLPRILEEIIVRSAEILRAERRAASNSKRLVAIAGGAIIKVADITVISLGGPPGA